MRLPIRTSSVVALRDKQIFPYGREPHSFGLGWNPLMAVGISGFMNGGSVSTAERMLGLLLRGVSQLNVEEGQACKVRANSRGRSKLFDSINNKPMKPAGSAIGSRSTLSTGLKADEQNSKT
jgi:hypothetical protein